ncbi:MAG: hypothetical protein LUI85_08435 [Bacteroides sp.]|nr:hypothetical protein [Bacteroides sp.]
MKVVSLLGSDFVESCRLLTQKISKDYNPDLVIGVLTGGGYVGKEIFHFLPHSEKQLYIETKIQRVNTKTKEKGIIKRILKYSPTFLLDWMRMLEAIVLEQKAKRENNLKREGVISFPPNVDSFLKSEFKKVLLIDDAIDSGATLHLLKGYLEDHYANVIVKVAVITVTTPNPIVNADYFLFHDRVLVRFPWSNDVKNKK